LNNLFDLTGKNAIVTGSGRGLGKGMALALAKAGANVGLISRTSEELEEVSKQISELSKKSFYQAIDIRDVDSVYRYVDDFKNHFGTIDILVNAAGLNVRKPFLEITDEDWELVLDVNLKSVLKVSQAIIPHFKKNGQGKIINIASLFSEIGAASMATYAASKGGVSQITKAMAVEFAQDGIQINAIGPGYYPTKMTSPVFNDQQKKEWLLSRIPMKRTGTEEDLAGTVIFLASSASDYITGQTIYVDGGWLSS